MDPILKYVPREAIFRLADQVGIQPGQVVSQTPAQNGAVGLTLFAFDKDTEISTHQSDGDALVTILEGTGQLTIAGTAYVLRAGESILMPAKTPHAVYAPEPFKMALLVVFPGGG